MKVDAKTVAELRRARENAALIARMRGGENFARIDAHESWYPQRPGVRKDPRELRRIFGDTTNGQERHA